MDVRNLGIEQAVEALDESIDFQLQLIGADHCAVDRRVQSGSVSACGKDADAFH
jgi:hypothetical protein